MQDSNVRPGLQKLTNMCKVEDACGKGKLLNSLYHKIHVACDLDI